MGDSIVANFPTALVAANRATVYGTVARWVLHNIRNPTQALSLAAELAEVDQATLDRDLPLILRDSTRHLTDCVELLDRILRVSPRATEVQPVAVTDVLAFVAQLYHAHRPAAQLDIAAVASASLPAVTAREEELEHALLNLVMNALEAVGNREDGRIVVSANCNDGQVELTIDDNGPGLAPTVRDRIFAPYITTKPPDRAAGLGLAVSRHLIENWRGTLTHVPKPEPGAKFSVKLLAWSVATR